MLACWLQCPRTEIDKQTIKALLDWYKWKCSKSGGQEVWLEVPQYSQTQSPLKEEEAGLPRGSTLLYYTTYTMYLLQLQSSPKELRPFTRTCIEEGDYWIDSNSRRLKMPVWETPVKVGLMEVRWSVKFGLRFIALWIQSDLQWPTVSHLLITTNTQMCMWFVLSAGKCIHT